MAVAVQSIASDVARWISAPTPGTLPAPAAFQRQRSNGSKSGAPQVHISYASGGGNDFARAVMARLRLERPGLRIQIEGDDERAALAETMLAQASRGAGKLQATLHDVACAAASAVIVALTSETFSCPTVLRELAACLHCHELSKKHSLPVADASAAERDLPELCRSLSDRRTPPKLAFVYHVRSCRGEDPKTFIRSRAPAWLTAGLEKHFAEPLSPASSKTAAAAAVPIFEYLHEYDDLCASAVLQWLDAATLGCGGTLPGKGMPSQGTLSRLQSGVKTAKQSLQSPERLLAPSRAAQAAAASLLGGARSSLASTGPLSSTLTTSPGCLPAIKTSKRGMAATSVPFGESQAGLGLGIVTSPVKSSVKGGLRPIAVGLVFDKIGRGAVIAQDVAKTCERTFGDSVKTAEIEGNVPLDSVANVLIIISHGAFRSQSVLNTLLRAIRAGVNNLLLLQDMCTVPNIWSEFEALPEAIRPMVASIIALPYLTSHGFSACLARIAGTDLLRPVNYSEGDMKKKLAAQYGRVTNAKMFDLFLCHYQRTGLDWAFAMRLGFVHHAGTTFRTFLDLQSLQNAEECGRFVEQSHAIALLITPGIFTRYYCQRELLLSRRANVQVIFVQHMRSCIDLEQELEKVRLPPSDFMAKYGAEYTRAGGSEEHFKNFQGVFFEQIWTQRFRPAVFAYIHELEKACVEEIVGHLKHRRRRPAAGALSLDNAARALLTFLRMSPDDRLEARAGLTALANQAASGTGDEFSAALVRVSAVPAVAAAMEKHASVDAGVAQQALRSLRTCAKTSAGQAVMLQFAQAEGALNTLHKTVEQHCTEASDEHLRKECLEVLRCFATADASVQMLLQRTGLQHRFDHLFRKLRAELEPLDEIRECLGLQPLQLTELEFALHNWQKKQHQQSGAVECLPTEVQKASELLRSCAELKDAVAAGDDERVSALLKTYESDFKRCAGTEVLLKEAHSLALVCQQKTALRDEEARTGAARLERQRQAQEELESLLCHIPDAPEEKHIADLEAAIVTGEQRKCGQAMLERAHAILKELRCAFETPEKFLRQPGQFRHVSASGAVRALLLEHLSDRRIVYQGVQAVQKLVAQGRQVSTAAEQAAQASTWLRSDVLAIGKVLQEYRGDLQVQLACCESVTGILQATRHNFDANSARALVANPINDEVPIVADLVAMLAHLDESLMREMQPDQGLVALAMAACACMAELARAGDIVVDDLVRQKSLTRIWRLLHCLGEDGRRQHLALVQQAVVAWEEVARHGRGCNGQRAIAVLLRLCDVCDVEEQVCAEAMAAICRLLAEVPGRSLVLVRYSNNDARGELAPEASPGRGTTSSWHSQVDDDGSGLRIVLRMLRIHPSHTSLQELSCRCLTIATQMLLKEAALNGTIVGILFGSVVYAIAAFRGHFVDAGIGNSAAKLLASLVDVSGEAFCRLFASEDGTASLVQVMGRHKEDAELQHSGLKVLSMLCQYCPQAVLEESSIKSIVRAMNARRNDIVTQTFGCSALRRLAEQGMEVAQTIGRDASAAVLAALAAFESNVTLSLEALRALQLAAESKADVAIFMGEKLEAVPTVLAALRATLDTLRGGAALLASLDVTQNMAQLPACLAAVRCLRALCEARETNGASFERLFHRGLCQSVVVFVQLLDTFQESHDVQLETLALLHLAIAPDKTEGASMVGPGLLCRRRGGSKSSVALTDQLFGNMVLNALHRFHADTDCIVIFALVSALAVNKEFARTVSTHSSLLDLLRWTDIFRSDPLVQGRAMRAFAAVCAGSEQFDTESFLKLEGLESIILARARHGDDNEVMEAATAALLKVAEKCPPADMYATATSVLCWR
eukprot:TRINITY_DN18503_c0_g1_i2.p1 TRINITY_DN18503_c0_g1~~TRINITY_DN18503_c0_g1_i2.p1  ORF type:complete len:1840 (+),score=439.67 TRINITY_DN18503_c0_g1_i2:58-5577(+)